MKYTYCIINYKTKSKSYVSWTRSIILPDIYACSFYQPVSTLFCATIVIYNFNGIGADVAKAFAEDNTIKYQLFLPVNTNFPIIVQRTIIRHRLSIS